MSHDYQDLFDDLDIRPPGSKQPKPKMSSSINSWDDLFGDEVDTRKDSKVEDTDNDDLGQPDQSNSYHPSFGKSKEPTQSLFNQTRPATANPNPTFDSIFSPSRTQPNASNQQTNKPRKSVTFDEEPLVRPSTAPSTAMNTPNLSGEGVLSSLRTGLEPTASNNFSKPPTGSGSRQNFGAGNTLSHLRTSLEPASALNVSIPRANDNYLGVESGASDDESDGFFKSTESPKKVTTPSTNDPFSFVDPGKKPAQPAKPVQQTKKSSLDTLLEDDRKMINQAASQPDLFKTLFSEKSPTTPKTVESNKPIFETTSSTNERKRENPEQAFLKPKTNFSSANVSSNMNSLPDVERLQKENEQLRMTIDHIKNQHKIQEEMSKESFQHQLDYTSQLSEHRETRLKEENEYLIRQLQDRTQQYEKEKAAMIIDCQRRLEESERNRTNELENLRNIQRQTVEHLRREHEQTVQRLKQLNQDELLAAIDVTSHTRAFENVVGHMEQNAKSLDELRLKLEQKHQSILNSKETEANKKEQQLKIYEERLQNQTVDFERERKNLQDLISRLEVHLAEQTKLVEEERWKALQSQKRMEAMQDALSGEQRLFTEKIARERAEIQRNKEQILEEQKISLASIYEARSKLAEDRAKLEALQKSFEEQKHRSMLQTATVEAEIRAQQKLLAEQSSRLDKREQDLAQREESIAEERRSVNAMKQRFESEQSRLKSESDDVQRKMNEIEQLTDKIRKEKERLVEMNADLQVRDGRSIDRLQKLQKTLNQLHQHEQQIGDQYSRMPASETMRPSRSALPTHSIQQLPIMTATLPTNFQQNTVEQNGTLRSLRMTNFEDQLYIQNELAYLQTLARTPSHLTSRSVSVSSDRRKNF